MNGGRIEISIAAVYTEFEKSMKEAESKAAGGGRAIGEKFASGFGSGSTGYMDRAINDIRGKLTKAVGAFTLVTAFGEALKAGAETGDWKAALEKGIKSVPVVSTFVGWGEALYDIINQTASKAAANQETVAQQQRLTDANKMKVDAANKAREEAAAATKAKEEEDQKQAARSKRLIEKSAREASLIQQEIEIRQLEATGDKRAAIIKQAQLEARRAFFESTDTETTTSEETKAVRKLLEARVAAINEEQRQRLRALDEEEAERSKKEAAAAAERQRKMDEETVKLLEREQELAAAVAEERVALGAATGAVSTAFGTFRFAGYTDAEKKANDKQMVTKLGEISKNTERMIDEVRRGGSGGFN